MQFHCISAKVGFIYLKSGGAVKCVSSLHSKPLTMIVSVTVESIRKSIVVFERFRYFYISWGNIFLFKHIGLETILVLLGL